MPVGFIGLGKMGGNMALRLLDQGHELVVTDIDQTLVKPALDAGATWAGSPAEVAALCSLVLSSLPGPAQVEAVALGPGGIIEGIEPGSVYVDLSTSTPTQIRKVNEAFAAKGGVALDAPVSGNPQHCREGSIAIWIGGEAADVERVRPVLADMSRELTHVGPLGSGSVAKLVNNAVGLATFKLLGEAISVGVKAGIDHQTLLSILQQGAFGRGLYLTMMVPSVAFRHAFEPAGFTLGLARKDLSLATALGRELNVPLPVLNLVEQDAVELVQRGHAAKDTAVLFSLQEGRAGVAMHDSDVEEVEL